MCSLHKATLFSPLQQIHALDVLVPLLDGRIWMDGAIIYRANVPVPPPAPLNVPAPEHGVQLRVVLLHKGVHVCAVPAHVPACGQPVRREGVNGSLHVQH